MENDFNKEWINSVLLFLACLTAMLVISEIAFSWIPRELHQQAGAIWALSGALMMLWSKYGHWDE